MADDWTNYSITTSEDPQDADWERVIDVDIVDSDTRNPKKSYGTLKLSKMLRDIQAADPSRVDEIADYVFIMYNEMGLS